MVKKILLIFLLTGCASSSKNLYNIQPNSIPNKIALLGEVNNKGLYEYSQGMNVIHGIANASGPINRRIKKDEIRIIRNGHLVHVVNLNNVLKGTEQIPELYPGDIIFCESSTWAKVSDAFLIVLSPIIDIGGAILGSINTFTNFMQLSKTLP